VAQARHEAREPHVSPVRNEFLAQDAQPAPRAPAERDEPQALGVPPAAAYAPQEFSYASPEEPCAQCAQRETLYVSHE
jgi:hypothetical protein